jgi:hypothetical protein
LEGQLRRFRVTEPNVVFETFDEEIVAVNLDTGNYYSISRSGPKIWMDIVDGFGEDDIVDRARSRHNGEREAITSEVTSFLNRLIAEGLIVENSNSSPRTAAATKPVADKTPFESPRIENYSDMQDLLMLDPIHDVDPAGWPVAKTNS